MYAHGEFWIACDFCDVWYCGSCAGVMPDPSRGIKESLFVQMDEENAQDVSKWKCTVCKKQERSR